MAEYVKIKDMINDIKKLKIISHFGISFRFNLATFLSLAKSL